MPKKGTIQREEAALLLIARKSKWPRPRAGTLTDRNAERLAAPALPVRELISHAVCLVVLPPKIPGVICVHVVDF